MQPLAKTALLPILLRPCLRVSRGPKPGRQLLHRPRRRPQPPGTVGLQAQPPTRPLSPTRGPPIPAREPQLLAVAAQPGPCLRVRVFLISAGCCSP